MKLLLFCLFLGSVLGDLSVEWEKFKRDYNKKYASVAEELERKQIFIDNVNKMRNHQQTYPDATFTMGVNHLTDRRIQELVSGKIFSSKRQPTPFQKTVDVKDFPDSLDWRVKGVVSPARDQGMVGEIESAIVSTEVIETFHAIETKKLIEGSVSRVYDCCPSETSDIFECIQKLGGICSNSAYPTQLNTCEPNKCQPFATFDRIDRLANKSESTMLAWIQESTLWAEVDASEFTTYRGGIYESPECSQTEIDHVIQIVGYGSENGIPFWICKNSWGQGWGEHGYIRIVRGKNMCAITVNVVKVANAEKSGATRSQTILPLSFIILLTMIVRQMGNFF